MDMAVGRFTMTPSAPSDPCSHNNTTVWRKFGSRRLGAAIRKMPLRSSVSMNEILPCTGNFRKHRASLNRMCRSGLHLVQRRAAVAKQIVVAIQTFVAGLGRINLDDG